MFQKLVNHNDDLRCLVEKGYAVAFDEGYLVIRDIPYLDNQHNLLMGAIVAKLVFVDKDHVRQNDHQIFFAGSSPHGLDGKPIPNLGDRKSSVPLGSDFADVLVERSFSNKPRKTGSFANFFEKIESYVAIISGPAMELHGASPYTYRVADSAFVDSVFKFQDTMTSRADIMDLSEKFRDEVIAVIGLGGTGSYLLDLLAKIPAREIRIFDLDPFHVHNAFRSPGKVSEDEFGKPKAEVYGSRYSSLHSGIKSHVKFVDSTCTDDLEGVTFAFVCVDSGPSRAEIFDLLLDLGIPFIDVGMGLKRKHGSLGGMMRVTYFSKERGKRMRGMGLAEVNETPDDLYRSNIQIAELNAMNACLAIMRYKQILGFYRDGKSLDHFLFNVSDLTITGEQYSGDEDEAQAS